eukprot:487046_1
METETRMILANLAAHIEYLSSKSQTRMHVPSTPNPGSMHVPSTPSRPLQFTPARQIHHHTPVGYSSPYTATHTSQPVGYSSPYTQTRTPEYMYHRQPIRHASPFNLTQHPQSNTVNQNAHMHQLSRQSSTQVHALTPITPSHGRFAHALIPPVVPVDADQSPQETTVPAPSNERKKKYKKKRYKTYINLNKLGSNAIIAYHKEAPLLYSKELNGEGDKGFNKMKSKFKGKVPKEMIKTMNEKGVIMIKRLDIKWLKYMIGPSTHEWSAYSPALTAFVKEYNEAVEELLADAEGEGVNPSKFSEPASAYVSELRDLYEGEDVSDADDPTTEDVSDADSEQSDYTMSDDTDTHGSSNSRKEEDDPTTKVKQTARKTLRLE